MTSVVGRGPRRYPSHALTPVTAGHGSSVATRGHHDVAAGTLVLVFPPTSLGTRELAEALGYSDERHLVRRFRERTGDDPAAVQRRGHAMVVT